ncbi:MAG: lamin tail domain-containing protein [Vicingaceae bacterium]
MRKNSFFNLLAAALLFTMGACETDDIEPTIIVSLSSSQANLFEAGGSLSLNANLNAPAPSAVSVDLILSGSALGNGQDYTLSSNTINIPEGSQSASVVLNAVQDNLQEGNESIEIAIASATNAEIAENNNQLSITLEDDDVAATAQFILNEICYDPSNSALDGDANGDGVYSQDDDSFVELYNPSSRDFDLGGYEIWDDTTSGGSNEYTFPSGTIIPSMKALVVFGGGTPTGSFGGSTVLNAGSGLNFNNSGEVIGIKAPDGSWYLTFDSDALSGNPNESYTRNPDITGNFEQHGRISGITSLFSPGTKIDGTPF